MGKNKRNISEVLTVIIALTALLTSMVNVYYQFFDNYTEFNAKYTGTSVKHLKDNYDSDISFLFLNTGNTEVALISGYIFITKRRHDMARLLELICSLSFYIICLELCSCIN